MDISRARVLREENLADRYRERSKRVNFFLHIYYTRSLVGAASSIRRVVAVSRPTSKAIIIISVLVAPAHLSLAARGLDIENGPANRQCFYTAVCRRVKINIRVKTPPINVDLCAYAHASQQTEKGGGERGQRRR